MNLAWLVKEFDDSDWEIRFQEPRYYSAKKAIAWVELKDGEPKKDEEHG